jgi:signal transduction histidine kinase
VARREGDALCVRVEDSGPGFRNGNGARMREGIGLANTRARLEQLYGDAQSLACGNLEGGGAFVQVRLPFREPAVHGSAA